ncbi:TIGR02452 family protein [Candidatus Woesearchaeota archaeon]|nr:TIGR02452 family protein [Candidatus Woesearchaeota archaeon]
MKKQQRKQIAQETARILSQGYYTTPEGKHVDISEDLAHSCKETTVYTPATLPKLLRKITSTKLPNRETKLEVTQESTLQAAQRLTFMGDALCLNFASAKNPAGGFLNGADAQEESLARASGLYATLTTPQAKQYYDANAACNTNLYTDHIIFSPRVPVFRDEDGMLLEEPYYASFLTVPAVNKRAIERNEPHKSVTIEEVMRQRTQYLLAVAAEHEHNALVLGAWGCGVFKNKPRDIARHFSEQLKGPFAGRFGKVVFAIVSHSDELAQVFRDALQVSA